MRRCTKVARWPRPPAVAEWNAMVVVAALYIAAVGSRYQPHSAVLRFR
jgi:hypothetical protein